MSVLNRPAVLDNYTRSGIDAEWRPKSPTGIALLQLSFRRSVCFDAVKTLSPGDPPTSRVTLIPYPQPLALDKNGNRFLLDMVLMQLGAIQHMLRCGRSLPCFKLVEGLGHVLSRRGIIASIGSLSLPLSVPLSSWSQHSSTAGL